MPPGGGGYNFPSGGKFPYSGLPTANPAYTGQQMGNNNYPGPPSGNPQYPGPPYGNPQPQSNQQWPQVPTGPPGGMGGPPGGMGGPSGGMGGPSGGMGGGYKAPSSNYPPQVRSTVQYCDVKYLFYSNLVHHQPTNYHM